MSRNRVMLAILLIGLFVVGCDRPDRPEVRSESASPTTPTPTPTWRPPSETELQTALGDDPPTIYGTVKSQTQQLPRPGPRDWLSQHRESGQSYQDYLSSSSNLPTPERKLIYLIPLNRFEADDPSLRMIGEFTEQFFGLPVVLSEPIKDLEPTTREDFLTHKEQWLAGPILDRLEEELPPDAYCVLGVTTYDIYPKEDWSFVFGLARLKGRVGVYEAVELVSRRETRSLLSLQNRSIVGDIADMPQNRSV